MGITITPGVTRIGGVTVDRTGVSVLGGVTDQSSTPVTSRFYITEDGSGFYLTEDGASKYITEA